MGALTSISPIDGRYYHDVADLSNYFSEQALMRYRLMVEVEYIIALGFEKKITAVPPFSSAAQKKLRNLYAHFSLSDAERVKSIEATTNHDVKAIEYFLKEKIAALPHLSPGRATPPYLEFIHFALTSEDINNLAFSLMWQDGVEKVYLPTLTKVIFEIKKSARAHRAVPLLALTHGQSASPTTIGKEFAVFSSRLERQLQLLHNHSLQGKLSGATGTWGAHVVSYPNVDWITFSKHFIKSLGLEPNLVTTQIENHDSLAESFHTIERINTILLDFVRDIWLYVMRGVLGQKKKAGETGSSTMPHKINPINFENAEGNLGLANAYLSHLAAKLPISRLQRDLSDSTVLRNLGVPLAHSLVACKNIIKGMSRLMVNTEKIHEELENHWEVVAEAIQTVLRKVGHQKPYEKLKELTRGQNITKEIIRAFITKLDIPKTEKSKLIKLTPHTYTGLAAKVV